MIAVLLTATLALSPASTAIHNDADLLSLAEREYAAGLDARADAALAQPHFRASAAAYEELWARGVRSPALARNLAQAHLLAGDLAHAIRAYHFGLRLAVYDSELRAGIAFARASVRFPMHGNLAEEAKARDRRTFLRYGPAWFFASIAVGIYLLAMLSLARGWMSRRPLWWVLGGVMATSAIMLSGAVLWENKHLADERALSIAVVAKSGARFHKGNSTEFPLRLPEKLPEGVEVVVLYERGGWLQVELGGGATGWVDEREVVRVDSKP